MKVRKSVMKVRAELHCYHCGYLAARVEGEAGQTLSQARLISPAIGPGVRLTKGRPPRCGRCGGPLYLDELEVIRYAPTVIVPLPPGRRRGRPPKALLQAMAAASQAEERNSA
jgi:hypothetical protein